MYINSIVEAYMVGERREENRHATIDLAFYGGCQRTCLSAADSRLLIAIKPKKKKRMKGGVKQHSSFLRLKNGELTYKSNKI